jgi:hypothetical protein
MIGHGPIRFSEQLSKMKCRSITGHDQEDSHGEVGVPNGSRQAWVCGLEMDPILAGRPGG